MGGIMRRLICSCLEIRAKNKLSFIIIILFFIITYLFLTGSLVFFFANANLSQLTDSDIQVLLAMPLGLIVIIIDRFAFARLSYFPKNAPGDMTDGDFPIITGYIYLKNSGVVNASLLGRLMISYAIIFFPLTIMFVSLLAILTKLILPLHQPNSDPYNFNGFVNFYPLLFMGSLCFYLLGAFRRWLTIRIFKTGRL